MDDRLVGLEARVAALEARLTADGPVSATADPSRSRAAADWLDVVPALSTALAAGVGGTDGGSATGTDSPAGLVLYAGVATDGDARLAWQMGRSWAEVRDADPELLAAPLAALASPARLRLVQRLLDGERTAPELAEDGTSTGQVYHHLNHLLAAGLVVQPRRGVYALPTHRIVPAVAALAASLDLVQHQADPGGPR